MKPLMANGGWLKSVFAVAATALLTLGSAACVADVDEDEELGAAELEAIAGDFAEARDSGGSAGSADPADGDLNNTLNWVDMEGEQEPDPIPWAEKDPKNDGHDQGGDQSGDGKP